MDSLCHPCITTTHRSYSVLSLKLPPPPCAVLLVFVRCYWYYRMLIGIPGCTLIWIKSLLPMDAMDPHWTSTAWRLMIDHCFFCQDAYFGDPRVSDTPSCLGTSLWSNCTRLIHKPASLLNVLSTSGDDLRRRAVEKNPHVLVIDDFHLRFHYERIFFRHSQRLVGSCQWGRNPLAHGPISTKAHNLKRV